MIDINLLPQKKRRVTGTIIVYAAIAVLWLVGTCYMGLLYVSGKQETASMQAQITEMDKKLNAQKGQQQTETVSVDSYLELSDRLQHLFYPTSLLLDELAKQLPEQGKLLSVSYNMDGKVEIEGRFEQYEDIAAYLYNVQRLPRVVKANIKSISAIKIEWEEQKDENDNPLSPSLQIVGGEILPHYLAKFEMTTRTLDEKKIRGKLSVTSGNTAEEGKKE